MDITIAEQIDDAVGELARRRREYPYLVETGKMTVEESRYQRRVQEAIIKTLRLIDVAQRQLTLWAEEEEG